MIALMVLSAPTGVARTAVGVLCAAESSAAGAKVEEDFRGVFFSILASMPSHVMAE